MELELDVRKYFKQYIQEEDKGWWYNTLLSKMPPDPQEGTYVRAARHQRPSDAGRDTSRLRAEQRRQLPAPVCHRMTGRAEGSGMDTSFTI